MQNSFESTSSSCQLFYFQNLCVTPWLTTLILKITISPSLSVSKEHAHNQQHSIKLPFLTQANPPTKARWQYIPIWHHRPHFSSLMNARDRNSCSDRVRVGFIIMSFAHLSPVAWLLCLASTKNRICPEAGIVIGCNLSWIQVGCCTQASLLQNLCRHMWQYYVTPLKIP